MWEPSLAEGNYIKTMETVNWHLQKLRFQTREKTLQGRVLQVMVTAVNTTHAFIWIS